MSGWMVESWYEKRKRMAMREKGQYWNYVVVLNLEIGCLLVGIEVRGTLWGVAVVFDDGLVCLLSKGVESLVRIIGE